MQTDGIPSMNIVNL